MHHQQNLTSTPAWIKSQSRNLKVHDIWKTEKHHGWYKHGRITECEMKFSSKSCVLKFWVFDFEMSAEEEKVAT